MYLVYKMVDLEQLNSNVRKSMEKRKIQSTDILQITVQICKHVEVLKISGEEKKRIALVLVQSLIPQDYFNARLLGIIIDDVVLLGLHRCARFFGCF